MHVDEDSVHVHLSDHHGSEPPILSAKDAAQNIAFGSIAGMVSEIFEYPFDLAKVRLQSQLLSASSHTHMRFNGPIDCLRQTWRDEGFRGLYRGLPAPIVGSMAETAALFLAYSSFQNLIRAYTPTPRNINYTGHPQPLSIPQLGLAAAGAGFVTSFILTPIELVKCKMQVQMMNISLPSILAPHGPISAIASPMRVLPVTAFSTTSSPISNFMSNAPRTMLNHPPHPAFVAAGTAYPPGPFSIINSTIRTHGVRGLWLGHTGTLLRETGGTAAWFVVKELVARVLQARRAADAPPTYDTPQFQPSATSSHADGDNDLLPWESALSGAIAGAACVLALYPADTVKSAMQTEEELRSPHAGSMSKYKLAPASHRTFMGTLARMYTAHGIRGLYAGCGMTVARAVPGSGIVFVVYDGLTAWAA